jgi:hypothetical protein
MRATDNERRYIAALSDPNSRRRIYVWFWALVGLGLIFFLLSYPLALMWDDMELSRNRVFARLASILVWPDLVASSIGCFASGPETAPHSHSVGLLFTQFFGWGWIGLGVGFLMAIRLCERSPKSG